MRIAMVRRQSPDWQSLARDFRAGRAIDPARYTPRSAIPGFPPRIDRLIAQWNARFRIDFFTFRGVLAALSQASVAAVRGADIYRLDEMPIVLGSILQRCRYCCFHDDDDFFAPTLAGIFAHVDSAPDAIVTPLLRMGMPNFTFCRHGCVPSLILGERRLHDFRYQTNNYALHVRQLALPERVQLLKDHVLASELAGREGFIDQLRPEVVSATVKTPGSAMLLPVIFANEQQLVVQFEGFIRHIGELPIPGDYDWLASPLRRILKLVQQVYAGADYDSIVDLLTENGCHPAA